MVGTVERSLLLDKINGNTLVAPRPAAKAASATAAAVAAAAAAAEPSGRILCQMKRLVSLVPCGLLFFRVWD